MDAKEQQEILDAIGRVEGKLDQKTHADEERFRRIEEDVTDVRARVTSLAEADVKFAGQMTKIAGAAADAADVGLKAMRRAAEAEDAATKIVQSAMTIHNASIAATVHTAVTTALEPVKKEITDLKVNDDAQNKALVSADDQMKLAIALLSKLSRWQNHWAFKVAFACGAIAAGVYYAMKK